jgi:hypothetical protein
VKKPARSSRRLQFEDLERREMMAVTASLNTAGTLNVTGTQYYDNLRFYQIGTTISLAGVGSWSAGNVKSINVDLGQGNDAVSFVTLTTSGAKKIAADITVKSSAGDGVAHFDGHDVKLSGAGHTLTVSAAGVATLDGTALDWNSTVGVFLSSNNNPAPKPVTPAPAPAPAPKPAPTPAPPAPVTNWFDTHVTDAALRALGHNLYLDGKIDRSDMISILKGSENNGVVTATEFADLKAIVANTALFSGLDYVQQLASDVVNGNVANLHWQNTVSTNLAAGSSGALMDKLVSKWFYGADRPTDGTNYRQVAGQLFVGGATYQDIRQGYLGDCYFVSTLAETALKNPSIITNMFIVNGDGTYTVKFFNAGKPTYVTVDSYLPTDASGRLIYASMGSMYNNSGNELWVALAEKAYAQLNQLGFVRPGLPGNGQNTFAAIAGGYINAAQSQITGLATVSFTATTAANSFQAFVTAYNQGKEIGFASKTTPASSTVVGGHAYAVVGYNASNQTVLLFNPWGIQYGLVTMTWAQIQGSFSYFDRTA